MPISNLLVELTSPQILCQVPGILLFKLSSPRIWIGALAIGWGISTVLSVSSSLDSG